MGGGSFSVPAADGSLPLRRHPDWIQRPDPVGRALPRAQEPAPRPRPQHRLRGGPLPQHRGVLGPAHRDDHDPGRHVHPRLRLLRREDRPADLVRRGRAAAGRRGGRRAPPRARRRDQRRPRRPARRRRPDLRRDDPSRCATASPGMGIEVLIPDFDGTDDRLRTVMDARPDILNHNLETVRRLQKPVRKRARWDRSLHVLRRAKDMAREIGYPAHTKSSLMVGLGETREELTEAFEALRAVDVDILTIGQYLRPRSQHLPLERYYHPDEFAEMKAEATRSGSSTSSRARWSARATTPATRSRAPSSRRLRRQATLDAEGRVVPGSLAGWRPLARIERLFYHQGDGRRRVSRGALPQRPEPGSGHALRLVAQPVHGLRPPLHVLLRPRVRASRRPAVGRGVRALDPGQGQCRRTAPARAGAQVVARRGDRDRRRDRSVPAGRGPLPADPRRDRGVERGGQPVRDHHPRSPDRPRRRPARRGLAARRCHRDFSVPTLDPDIWRTTEPGTAPPRQRLRALRTLVDAGVRAGVGVAPSCPGCRIGRTSWPTS